MAKKDIIIVADYTQQEPLELEEICRIYNVPPSFIQDLVDYAVIHPRAQTEKWLFDLTEVHRVSVAQHLHRDLEVNVAGVALALDLLDQLHELQEQVELLEKHYKNNQVLNENSK